MKASFITLILHVFLFISFSVFAQAPVNITHDVHVNQGGQCPSTWRGRVGPEDTANYSSFGEYNALSAPGILSCTGCARDPQSNDCICHTCYADYN